MSEATAPSPAATGGAAFAYPWWAVLIQGIAALIIGILLFVNPASTTVVLVYFIGWWWLINGIFELVSLFWNREMWGWKVFSGILGIFAGGYIIAAPLLGAAVVLGVATLLLGINGIILGIADLIKAFQGAGWGKGILGALSLIFGVVIAFNFTTFATAMPWVWGIFATAGGIAAIIFSFQMRKANA